MKTALRIFAFAVVVAGAAAASFSSSRTHVMANHMAASAAMPTPSCAYCR